MERRDSRRPAEILLVEDNPGDAQLAREAFSEGRSEVTLHHVADGDEALAFLAARLADPSLRLPDLVLLDLNLPRTSGREVLSHIKTDPRTSRIPVIVLSTSSAERDVEEAYSMHANCYVAKPIDFDRFLEAIQAVEAFWLHAARLPGDR